MEQEKDKRDIVQSYLITTARYKFTPTEKRIMYRIIEAGQDLIEGRKLRGYISVENSLFKDKDITMKYSDVTDENHAGMVRKALLDLLGKKVIWGDSDKGEACTLIERPKWNEKRGVFSLRVPAPIWEAMMLHFEKGFRKYQLATAMNFNSVYTMRLYELISGQQTALTFPIAYLKTMLGVEGKYSRFHDFKKRVLDVAKAELDAKADFGFDFITTKNNIKLLPYPIQRESDEALETKRLLRRTALSWDLADETVRYLLSMGFTRNEIKNNREVFKQAQHCLDDILVTLAELKAKSRVKENPKGWIIQALRGKIKDAQNS